MGKIKTIVAREILNTKGEPAIETKITLQNELEAIASVPSGDSMSSFEAFDLRDYDAKRYFGRGRLRAISKVNDIIAPALKGCDILNQVEIDKRLISLDGSPDKSNLGANSILSVSFACARLAALESKQELYVYLQESYAFSDPEIPIPLFNIFNGGKHADTNLDFQEFLLIPRKNTALEMIRQGAEVFHSLGHELREAGYDSDVGLEGGYAPDLDSSIEAIELIMSAAIRAGYKPETDFNLGIDIGSSVLFDKNSQRYIFPLDNAYFQAGSLISLYEDWLEKYPITYIEDGLAKDDILNWQELTTRLGERTLVVGDDLFSSNSSRLRMGIRDKLANAIIIKPNQIGTLTETIDCVKLALKHNYKVVISHRSGETNDDFIADLAVACGASYIKAGALSRGERVAKYNRLLDIETKL